ncbi:MAG: hypothetical protein ACLGHA_04760 [Gammaproteobacteria bacterium]
MFEKILIANHGDQPPAGGAAAKPNRAAAVGCERDFAAGARYV